MRRRKFGPPVSAVLGEGGEAGGVAVSHLWMFCESGKYEYVFGGTRTVSTTSVSLATLTHAIHCGALYVLHRGGAAAVIEAPLDNLGPSVWRTLSSILRLRRSVASTFVVAYFCAYLLTARRAGTRDNCYIRKTCSIGSPSFYIHERRRKSVRILRSRDVSESSQGRCSTMLLIG